MNDNSIFKKVCPYFEENRCVSKYLSEMKLEGSIVPLCETEDYRKCPIFIESSKREKKK